MAIFQAFAAKITEIESFDEHKINDHENYEISNDYGSVSDKNFEYELNYSNLRLVTIKIGRAKLVKCVLDTQLLKLEEGSVIRIVYAGPDIIAVLSMVSGFYTYYDKPLYKKFSLPRVMSGIKASVCSAFGGYILHIMARHIQLEFTELFLEGLFFSFFIAGIIYSIYHGSSNKDGKRKMESYLQRLRA